MKALSGMSIFLIVCVIVVLTTGYHSAAIGHQSEAFERESSSKSQATFDVAGDALLSNALVTNALVTDALQLLFADGFDNDEVGSPPVAWETSSDSKYVSVVSEPELPSGKAVRIVSDPEKNNTSMSVTFGKSKASDAKIIVLEYQIKHSLQKNNNYMTKAGSHRLHWWVDRGRLYFNEGVGSQRSSTKIGDMQPGWNRIRLVAHIERQEVVFYLNDLEKPVGGPYTFGRPIDSWGDAQFILAQSYSPDRAFYYGDIKIWTASEDDLPEDIFSDERHESHEFQDKPIWSLYEGALTDGPVWLEYDDISAKPRAWWSSDEAKNLGLRIIRALKEGDDAIIGVPIGQLAVADGILPTQLSVLAYLYKTLRYETPWRDGLRHAFLEGVHVLIDSQFPSGGWPTIDPPYRNWDLHLDFYAASTWSEIPALFNDIILKNPPFDTDITEGIDFEEINVALGRIPERGDIRRFSYGHYAGHGLDWWLSEEAERIATNLMSWQLPHGGWWRNEAWTVLPYDPDKMTRSGSTAGGIERGRSGRNGTVDPMRFLAKMYDVTAVEDYKNSFLRGLNYLLEAQYESGGFPNSFPQPSGIEAYVMFNDDAMADVLRLFQDIAVGNPPFVFVTGKHRERVKTALEKGIDYIIHAQIDVDGRLTGWGQQHDPVTYKPLPFRSFEPVAISGSESVGVVEFLQSIPDPSHEVRTAILGALEWLQKSRLEDGRWARFYEIGTNRPIFAGRDGIVRYDVSEIELERQLGYGWFGRWAEDLLLRAEQSGYIERLYESLPDYPTVRLRFVTPRDGATVSGVIPITVEPIQSSHGEGVTKVTIAVDGVNVYSAESMPASDHVLIDTEALEDGRRSIVVTTVHHDLGTFRQSIDVNVRNRWKLVQNMAPPVTEGWFGTIDFLQTERRSEGWVYRLGDSDTFFGDAQRLARSTEATEWLIWETPRLRTVEMTLYVKDGVPVEEGLKLSTSSAGIDWEPVNYRARVGGIAGEWALVSVSLQLDDESDTHWFRLELSGDVSKEAVQIGTIVFEGLRPAQGAGGRE